MTLLPGPGRVLLAAASAAPAGVAVNAGSAGKAQAGPEGKAGARSPGTPAGSRAAEPPRPGPEDRPGLGKEREGRRPELDLFVGGSFEIALSPRNLSPCDCRITQPASFNSGKAWVRPHFRLGSPSVFFPIHHLVISISFPC